MSLLQHIMSNDHGELTLLASAATGAAGWLAWVRGVFAGLARRLRGRRIVEDPVHYPVYVAVRGDKFQMGHGITWEVVRVYPREVRVRVRGCDDHTATLVRSKFEADMARDLATKRARRV